MTTPVDHQLLYLVYGRDTFYREARFSIVSALLRSREPDRLKIVVWCQHPDRFADLGVTTRLLDDSDLQQWAGEINYNHRSKPCLLKRALADADKTVLVDTDTFFIQPPELLFEKINPAVLLVDEILEPWRTAAGGQLYRGFSPHVQEYQLDDAMPLINSGVIGVTGAHESLLDDTIELIDKIYLPGGKTFTTEQIALGMCARGKYDLRAQGGTIKHYWSRKHLFRSKIDAFLIMHHNDLLGDAARADLSLVKPSHPKPDRLSRLRYKVRLLRFPADHRQFYLELLYGTHDFSNKFDRASREAWWGRALTNWRERYGGSDQLLEQLMSFGTLEQILGDNYPAFKTFVSRS